jgi:hypothetical protein
MKSTAELEKKLLGDVQSFEEKLNHVKTRGTCYIERKMIRESNSGSIRLPPIKKSATFAGLEAAGKSSIRTSKPLILQA